MLVVLALAGCGGSSHRERDDLIVRETRREAYAAMNQATAQLGATLITNRGVQRAFRVYINAVNTATGVLPARYVVGDHLVGLVATQRRIAPWCKACAVELGRRARVLRARK